MQLQIRGWTSIEGRGYISCDRPKRNSYHSIQLGSLCTRSAWSLKSCNQWKEGFGMCEIVVSIVSRSFWVYFAQLIKQSNYSQIFTTILTTQRSHFFNGWAGFEEGERLRWIGVSILKELGQLLEKRPTISLLHVVLAGEGAFWN